MTADVTFMRAPDSVRLYLAEGEWAFARDHADAIDAHWAREKAANPAIFNGKVLVADAMTLANGVLEGRHLSVDFKAFLAWRDWGFSTAHAHNIFGSALLRPADGGLVMGKMGDHTSNPGKIYPASGTLDLSDVAPDGTIDIEASMRRELMEETGLDASDLEPGDAWLVAESARVSYCRVFSSPLTGAELVSVIRANLDRQDDRELADAVHVRRGDPTPDTIFLPYVRRLIAELA